MTASLKFWKQRAEAAEAELERLTKLVGDVHEAEYVLNAWREAQKREDAQRARAERAEAAVERLRAGLRELPDRFARGWMLLSIHYNGVGASDWIKKEVERLLSKGDKRD